MKSLSLITSFIMVFTLSANSQVSNNTILETFLNDTTFGKYLLPGFFKECDSLTIIDTTNCFLSVKKIKFSKKVIIKHQYDEKEYLKNRGFSSRIYCDFLFASVKKVKSKKYILSYYHAASNGAGFVKYKLVRGRLKKIKHEYGQY